MECYYYKQSYDKYLIENTLTNGAEKRTSTANNRFAKLRAKCAHFLHFALFSFVGCDRGSASNIAISQTCRSAEVINELLKQDLIDELIISVIPVLLGNGTRLFKEGRPEQLLEFITVKTFDTGLTQLHYKRKR